MRLLPPCVFSCGVWLVPIGVARLSFGSCRLGMTKGGRPEEGDCCDKGGAATLLTGLWLGDAGMAKPRRGTLGPDCDFPPGMGGLSRGAGEAMFDRSTGSTARREWLLSATLGSD